MVQGESANALGRMMRVVGGEWRGRPLTAPSGRATRPTSDKVREAIYDMLGARLAARDERYDDHNALDLFAGTGGLGIEALSRGALSCVFVENAQPALRALRTNLQRLNGAVERSRIVSADYRAALQNDARAGCRYTLVFADPPYALYGETESELRTLLPEVLGHDALVVVETAKGCSVDLPFETVRVKLYGDTQVTLMEAGR